jgi:predicted RNA-binding protein
MGSQTSKPIVQQRAPQVTDPVHLEVKRKIQQFRAIPLEEIEKRAQKLNQIDSQLKKESPQYEAILHDLFELFSELYANSSDEFAKDSGPAFHLAEIIYGLKYSHPEIDVPTMLKQGLTTFPGQKKIIQQKLVQPLLKEWAEEDAQGGAEA